MRAGEIMITNMAMRVRDSLACSHLVRRNGVLDGSRRENSVPLQTAELVDCDWDWDWNWNFTGASDWPALFLNNAFFQVSKRRLFLELLYGRFKKKARAERE
jgi:hypothetical protein